MRTIPPIRHTPAISTDRLRREFAINGLEAELTM